MILLLNGSPKPAHSTSASLGEYLLDRLTERGVQTSTLRINSSINTPESIQEMLTAIEAADIIILAFPLYVDSLPYGCMRAFEIIAEKYHNAAKNGQRMIAICNSGFPEASQSEIALDICKRFAAEVGFEWMGGLALGGGAGLDGKPLDKAGGMVRSVIEALNSAAEEIAAGQPLSEKTISLMAKPMMPSWLYLAGGNLSWHLQARKNRVHKHLNDKPYE